MMQSKTFLSSSALGLDDEINKFLKEHNKIEVKFMTQSSFGIGNYSYYHSLTILYTDNVSGVDKL